MRQGEFMGMASYRAAPTRKAGLLVRCMPVLRRASDPPYCAIFQISLGNSASPECNCKIASVASVSQDLATIKGTCRMVTALKIRRVRVSSEPSILRKDSSSNMPVKLWRSLKSLISTKIWRIAQHRSS